MKKVGRKKVVSYDVVYFIFSTLIGGIRLYDAYPRLTRLLLLRKDDALCLSREHCQTQA